jgi:hypothetical protein
MSYLTTVLGILFMLWERITGTKTVYEIKGPNNALGNLYCKTNNGYQLTIFCQRKEYLVKYDRWFIPNKSINTYRVMSLAVGDVPCAIRKACELDVDLPQFVTTVAPEPYIAKTMINAYLDLLQAKLGKLECIA